MHIHGGFLSICNYCIVARCLDHSTCNASTALRHCHALILLEITSINNSHPADGQVARKNKTALLWNRVYAAARRDAGAPYDLYRAAPRVARHGLAIRVAARIAKQ